MFYSTGIWIKNHLVDKFAKIHNGIGVNIIIDNDTPKKNLISIPNIKQYPPVIEDIKIGETNNEGLAYEETILPSAAETQKDHMPNLKTDDGLTELPFWIWRTNGSRKKVYVRRDRDHCLEILTENLEISGVSKARKASGDELVYLEKASLKDDRKNLERLKAISKDGFKIRPRALTNTLFLRLFFADVFVHGIGGAKYDIITDGIINDFFGVTAPDYITVSATLYPPFGKFAVEEKGLLQLKNELEQMRHNPDKYLPPEILDNPETKALILEKRRLIKVKTKEEDKKDAEERFLRIKEINLLLNDYITPIFEKKRGRN